MIIDYKNYQYINTDISIHDCVFVGLRYDYKNNQAIVYLNREFPKELICIKFYEVVAIDMVACDFWGPSVYVLDWSASSKEDGKIINKCISETNEKQYLSSKVNKKHFNLFETEMVLSSGDRLLVGCDRISFVIEQEQAIIDYSLFALLKY